MNWEFEVVKKFEGNRNYMAEHIYVEFVYSIIDLKLSMLTIFLLDIYSRSRCR